MVTRTSDMRLLLLASKSTAAPFRSILQQERIYYDLLPRVAFISHAPFSRRTYNGVILDNDIIAQHCQDDRNTLELLNKVLPCHIIPTGSSQADDQEQHQELRTFFKTCRCFPPRAIRQQARANINLPAQISTEANFTAPQNATTFNISPSGCFLDTTLNREIGAKIWLNLEGLEDPSPLLSEIRWFSQGTSAELPPGMGVRFLQASTSQVQQLGGLMRHAAASL